MKLSQLLIAATFALTLTTVANAQDEPEAPVAADVNVVNAVSVNSSDESPVVVRGTTQLAFRAIDMEFGTGDQVLAEVDVSHFERVRLTIAATRRLGFPVTIWIIEDGVEVQKLDSFTVYPCPTAGQCQPIASAVTKMYDVPGRMIRIRATGSSAADITIFGR